MRTFRNRAFGVLLFCALAFSSGAVAAPSASQGDDPLTTMRKFIVKVLDDVAIKIGLPPG